MSAIPRPRQARPPTTTATFIPGQGWTRPPSTTLATAQPTGGIYGSDVLAGVSSALTIAATPTISPAGFATIAVNVAFPDLPALACEIAEQPILLLGASVFATVSNLMVGGFDLVPSVLIPLSTTPLMAPYLPAGAKISSYAAQVIPLLYAAGSTVAPAHVVVRATAQLFVRRLT